MGEGVLTWVLVSTILNQLSHHEGEGMAGGASEGESQAGPYMGPGEESLDLVTGSQALELG
jgi:hypothetical protein